MNRIKSLFERKPSGNILSVYFTAGFPHLDDTTRIIRKLERQGADMAEIGVPFSDPLADGPVIQHSSAVALNNGMSLKTLFGQLAGIRREVSLPLVLMSYLNPIMQYGTENFYRDAASAGIDGVIIPDLPFDEYIREFKPAGDRFGVSFIMLVTPETSPERIRLIDNHTDAFIYMVSTASTTGVKDCFDEPTLDYFRRIDAMALKNPRLTGFGISNKATCRAACRYADGVIVGSLFVKLLMQEKSIEAAVEKLIGGLMQSCSK